MSTKYKLRVKNNSNDKGSFCVYQTCPDQDKYNIHSLAWFTKSANPETVLSFFWEIDYSLVLSKTGTLLAGKMFEVSQSIPINIQDQQRNTLTLSKKDTGYFLSESRLIGIKGALTIIADDTIPDNAISIGVQVSGKSAIAVNACTEMVYRFTPTPTYWIMFGDFKEGEVLDLKNSNLPDKKVFSKALKIVFEPNVYEKNIIFTKDNEWEVID